MNFGRKAAPTPCPRPAVLGFAEGSGGTGGGGEAARGSLGHLSSHGVHHRQMGGPASVALGGGWGTVLKRSMAAPTGCGPSSLRPLVGPSPAAPRAPGGHFCDPPGRARVQLPHWQRSEREHVRH